MNVSNSWLKDLQISPTINNENKKVIIDYVTKYKYFCDLSKISEWEAGEALCQLRKVLEENSVKFTKFINQNKKNIWVH